MIALWRRRHRAPRADSATGRSARTVAWPLPRDDTAAGRARDLTRTTLATWQLAEDLVGDCLLATSELVTNALRHAHGPITLRLACDDALLRCEVTDGSPVEPYLATPNEDEPRGRGLLVLTALAHDWGTHPHPDGGKTVWFTLTSASAAAVPA